MYVDDNLQVNMETAVRGEDEGCRFRDKHVMECQNSFCMMIRIAEEIGMEVNEKKTAMLCSSGAQSYAARSHLLTSSRARVSFRPKMKVLEYHFSSSSTAHAHIAALSKQIHSKYWVF